LQKITNYNSLTSITGLVFR